MVKSASGRIGLRKFGFGQRSNQHGLHSKNFSANPILSPGAGGLICTALASFRIGLRNDVFASRLRRFALRLRRFTLRLRHFTCACVILQALASFYTHFAGILGIVTAATWWASPRAQRRWGSFRTRFIILYYIILHYNLLFAVFQLRHLAGRPPEPTRRWGSFRTRFILSYHMISNFGFLFCSV